MRRRIFAILLLILTVFSVGCEKNREYDESEVILAAKTLIKNSAELNEIYWGKGIAHTGDISTSNGYYYEADVIDLKKYGIETVDGLIKKTGETFSKSYSENIFETKLSSVYDEEGIYSYARYYQKYSDAENKEPEAIMVYSKAINLLTDEVEYLYDTISCEGSKGETVYVKISVTVTRGDNSQEREITIGLIEEDVGWRIDTPTYISYDEQQGKK